MDAAIWVLIIALAVIAVVFAVGMWFSMQRRRSDELRDQFGPEYDRAVGEYGSEGEAEAALRDRKERVEKLKLRPLSREERDRFGVSWRDAQGQFVDDPQAAIRNAQKLTDAAMKARGFPLGDFDQRAADISVEHPSVVENYRAARDIAELNDRGEADTEQLRQAMVHYRQLFADLVNTPDRAESRGEMERQRDRGERRSRLDTRNRAPRGR